MPLVKPKVFASLLREHRIVLVIVRTAEAKLPDFLHEHARTQLHLGLDLPNPIPDLEWGLDELSATLSFGDRGRHHCVLPWDSVTFIGLLDGSHGVVWQSVESPPFAQPLKPASGHLKVVK